MNTSAPVGPIVTLTLNPALDVGAGVDVVLAGHKLRCDAPSAEPGGGGFNVSRVCQRLGHDTVAVAALGGPLGSQLGQLVEAEGIPLRTVPIAASTRQSVTIDERASGQQFRFVFPGPLLTSDEVTACLETTAQAAQHARCVVVSGSMPSGVDAGAIVSLVDAVGDTTLIVDTSGPALRHAVDAGVDLVKPSARELAALVDRELETETDVAAAADEVVAASSVGAVLVSIGAGGAILAERGGVRTRFRAPTVKVASAVGAGDSLVAGVASSLHTGATLREATAFGIACGTAAVLSPGTELCRTDDVHRLHPAVTWD